MSFEEKRKCTFAGCKNLVKSKEKFCYEHRTKSDQKIRPEKRRKNQLNNIEENDDE